MAMRDPQKKLAFGTHSFWHLTGKTIYGPWCIAMVEVHEPNLSLRDGHAVGPSSGWWFFIFQWFHWEFSDGTMGSQLFRTQRFFQWRKTTSHTVSSSDTNLLDFFCDFFPSNSHLFWRHQSLLGGAVRLTHSDRR